MLRVIYLHIQYTLSQSHSFHNLILIFYYNLLIALNFNFKVAALCWIFSWLVFIFSGLIVSAQGSSLHSMLCSSCPSCVLSTSFHCVLYFVFVLCAFCLVLLPLSSLILASCFPCLLSCIRLHLYWFFVTFPLISVSVLLVSVFFLGFSPFFHLWAASK